MFGYNWNWDLFPEKDDDVVSVKTGVITISDDDEDSKGSEGNRNIFSIPDTSDEDDCLEVPRKPPSIISIDSREENAEKPPIIINLDSDEDSPNPSNFGDELPSHSNVKDQSSQSSVGAEFSGSSTDGSNDGYLSLDDLINIADHECDSSVCEEDEARSSSSCDSEPNFFRFLASSSDESSNGSNHESDDESSDRSRDGSSEDLSSNADHERESSDSEEESGSSLSCESKLSLVGLPDSSDTDDSNTRLKRKRKAERKNQPPSKRFKRKRGSSDPRSVKACLEFPVGRIHRALMHATKFKFRMTNTAAVFTTSVLEFLTKTFLKLSGNVKHINRITTFLTRYGMLSDREFNFLLKTMLNYDVTDHVEKVLEFNLFNEKKESDGQSSKS